MKIKELKELIQEIANINTNIGIDDVMEVASINPNTLAAIEKLRTKFENIVIPDTGEEVQESLPTYVEEEEPIQLAIPEPVPVPEIVEVKHKELSNEIPEGTVYIKGKPLKVVTERDWDNLDDVKSFYAESIVELPKDAIKPSEEEFVKFAKVYAKTKRGGQPKMSFVEAMSTCKFISQLLSRTTSKKMEDKVASDLVEKYIHTTLGNKNVTVANIKDFIAGRTYGIITSYYFHRTNRILYKS
jgi:hypothetical protein